MWFHRLLICLSRTEHREESGNQISFLHSRSIGPPHCSHPWEQSSSVMYHAGDYLLLSKGTSVKWEWRTGNVDLTHFPVGGAEAEGEKINSQHMWEMLWEQVWATYIIYQWDVSFRWDKGWDFSIWGICVCHLLLPCIDGMSQVSDTGASVSISLIFSPHFSKARCRTVGGFLIIA